MKFKKWILSVAVVASVFGASQSAFAISGLADDYASAVPFALNHELVTFIAKSDSDWYTYQNNTSSTQFVVLSALAYQYNPSLNVDLEVYLKSPNNSGLVYLGTAADSGPGLADVYTRNLLPGETIVWVVNGHNPESDIGIYRTSVVGV
ncbi:hypothetical protein [Paenibacillus kobensis]|uniref:hypothetical protein n=1 Tax=Paenibacillus kobensis TaxID=59841 RepID=UPI000FDB2907|nr:hypothetical protein [Paenibacillus kobensis]